MSIHLELDKQFTTAFEVLNNVLREPSIVVAIQLYSEQVRCTMRKSYFYYHTLGPCSMTVR